MPELTRPIIICGVARSGTTFVQDLLDAHPDIGVSDEFFLYRMPAIQSLFTELNAAVAKRAGAENWPARKVHLMRTLWFHASREVRLAKGMHSRRFANKTPGAEHYVDFYDDVFSAAPPLYVYMLREGRKVFISRNNMQWGTFPTIQQQLKRYLDSINVIEDYRSRHADRVLVFQVDRIEPTPEARAREVERLFAFLQEEIVDEVARFVQDWQPAQTTTQHLRKAAGAAAVTELPPDDQTFLDRSAEYQAVMRRWGY